mgnify:CR=1 FL=1
MESNTHTKMSKGEKETARQARAPQQPPEHMADKGKGSRAKTPALPMTDAASHVPARAAEHMAAKAAPSHGLDKMATMGTEHRRPVMAPSHKNSDGKPGMKMGG